MGQKLDENLKKFYKVDKYQKAVAKDSTDVKSLEKLEKATALYNASKPFLENYNDQGKDKTAQLIADNVDLSMVEESKMKDVVAKFLRLDTKKNAAFDDVKAKSALD
jgi:hypothetical protein